MTRLLIALALLCSSCAYHRFDYEPPGPLDPAPSNQMVVDASFDETWAALISGIGERFFSIEEFEKESGLLTLAFSVSPIRDAVEGGTCEMRYQDPNTLISRKFDGLYTDYLERYCAGLCTGRVNLVVQEVSPSQTRVTANIRFTVIGVTVSLDEGTQKMVWTWHSGETCTRQVEDSEGEIEERTLQSSLWVEETLLGAIDAALDLGAE